MEREKRKSSCLTYFLHGLFGTGEDWPEMPSSVFLDLPGHGSTPLPRTDDLFNYTEQWLLKQFPEKCNLVGYSMGGRLALTLALKYRERFDKVAIISAHPGIEHTHKREEIDQNRAGELRAKGLQQFLNTWYKDPIFSTLRRKPFFHKIMQRRLKQNPSSMASVLEGLSVAKQEYLWDKLPSPNLHFFYGDEDIKYLSVAHRLKQLGCNVTLVPSVGHAFHLEEPSLFQSLTREYLYGK